MDCFFPALREKSRDFFVYSSEDWFIHRNILAIPVPADLKSAVKKGSTYENGGFVIPL